MKAKIETQRHKIHHVVCFATQKFHSQLEKCASNQTAVCLKNVSLKPGRFDPSVPLVTLTQKSMINASATIRRARQCEGENQEILHLAQWISRRAIETAVPQ